MDPTMLRRFATSRPADAVPDPAIHIRRRSLLHGAPAPMLDVPPSDCARKDIIMRGTAMARIITVIAEAGAVLAIAAVPVQAHEAPAVAESAVVETAGSAVVETEAAVRVTGVLQRGVEGGCFTLRTSSALYVLRGEVNEFMVGRRVAVTGEFTTDTGPCMQGRTIDVHSMVLA